MIVAYALLGSTWLTMKTEGALQGRMIAIARRIVPVLLVGIGVVSLWTPLAHRDDRRPVVLGAEHLLFRAGADPGAWLTCWQLMRLLTGGSEGRIPRAGAVPAGAVPAVPGL